jgi:hypothetical protein
MIRTMLFSVALALISIGSMAADPLNFYVGFTGVQTQDASGGKIRYVNVMVGSNEETSQADAYTTFFQLGVRGPDGTIVCNTGVELTTKVRPAVQPLRFQIFYPSQPIDRRPIRQFQKEYKLFAKIEVRMPGTSQLIERDQQESSYLFPSGGTPSCEILMKP